ncbi:hypothetical protein CERSUDRAFT_116636, partial [Gelatoporia subvermispora B]
MSTDHANAPLNDPEVDVQRCCHISMKLPGRLSAILRRHSCKSVPIQNFSRVDRTATNHSPPANDTTNLADARPDGLHDATIASEHPRDASAERLRSTIKQAFQNDQDRRDIALQLISKLIEGWYDHRPEDLRASISQVQWLFHDQLQIISDMNVLLPLGYHIESGEVVEARNLVEITSDENCLSIPGGDLIANRVANTDGEQSIQNKAPGICAIPASPVETPSCDQLYSPSSTQDIVVDRVNCFSETFRDLAKLHFRDEPDVYSEIAKRIDAFISGSVGTIDFIAQLSILLWGCVYMLRLLDHFLPAGRSVRFSTALETRHKVKLCSPTTADGKTSINVEPNVSRSTHSRESGRLNEFVVSEGSVVRYMQSHHMSPRVAGDFRQSHGHTFTIFENVKWLGGDHDGHLISHSWEEYFQRRRSVPLYTTSPSDPGNDALAQSWFTLGLLESVVEKNIPAGLILDRTPTGDAVLSSRHLPLVLRDWRQRMRALRAIDEDAFRQWFHRGEVALKALLQFIIPETRLPDRSIFKGPNYLANLHMFASIGEILMASMADFQDFRQPMAGYVWSIALARYPVWKLYEAGWCPFTVSILLSSVCIVQYASSCKPHFRRGLGQRTFDHSKCTREGCSLNNIDPAVQYVNRHTDDSC